MVVKIEVKQKKSTSDPCRAAPPCHCVSPNHAEILDSMVHL